MTQPDEAYFAAQATRSYYRINADRARGVLAEKESTKAAASIALRNAPDATTFLDAGCSSGHLLRSLLAAGLPVRHYVGIDLDEPAIESAQAIWGSQDSVDTTFSVSSVSSIPLGDSSVDVAISLNVLEHMRSLRPTLDELMRVTRRLVILRTSIWHHTYIIQEVRNAAQWSGDNTTYAELPAPAEELSIDGDPRNFVYQNMWGQDYLSAQVQQIDAGARLVIRPDTMYSSEELQRDASSTGLPNAAQVINGQQVVGPLILPHCWVLIRLDDGPTPEI